MSAAVPSLPDVLTLGRSIRDLDAAHDLIDEALSKKGYNDHSLEKKMTCVLDQLCALRDLSLATAPATLGDVAVQMQQAFILIDGIQASDDKDMPVHALCVLRRIVAGAFPIVTKAAGIDPGDIALSDSIALMAYEFGGGQ
jgi:hypothetical protein